MAAVTRRQMKSSGSGPSRRLLRESWRRIVDLSSGSSGRWPDAMTVELHAGLISDGDSNNRMLIIHVDNLPTRDELSALELWSRGATSNSSLLVFLPSGCLLLQRSKICKTSFIDGLLEGELLVQINPSFNTVLISSK
ncbi:hexokinase A [Castilleja foliolosa]|uniref:Hexokinase A n=1 Tax=Castilleja foliolosa TaxID=1961234 RepID=A0ABD3C6M3_9LAMI